MSVTLAALLIAASLVASDSPGVEINLRSSFSQGMLAPWTPRESGWAVDEPGSVAHEDPFFHGGVLALHETVMTSVTVEAEARLSAVYHDRDSVWAGIMFRAETPLFHGWNRGYVFFIRANGEAVLHVGGSGAAQTHATSLRPGEDYVRLRVEAVGSRLRCWLNGEPIFDVQDERYSSGEVALVHFGNKSVFRNVIVKGEKMDSPVTSDVHPEQPTPVPHPPVTPLSAVELRQSKKGPSRFFLRDTGASFVPVGFNHTILNNDGAGWHATFNTDIYNGETMDATLAAMASAGANTLRVWAWGVQDETGFTGGQDARGLNGAYMENFVDFLRRATRHGLYVIPILDETPHNERYNALSRNAEAEAVSAEIVVAGYNRNYLSPGPLAAKAAGAADFVRYVRDADPGLLNTVLCWSLANEAFVNHSEPPFCFDKGTVVTSTGRVYDMADRESRQACYDETIVHWTNTLSDAIKAVAPEALVTVGMWTSDAHRRLPLNYLLPDDKDPRIPPRPSVLSAPDCRLDVIDIHIYPWDGTSKVRPHAHEWDAVYASGKGAIVGEYGVFKDKSIDQARTMMGEMLTQAFDMGYQGALHWVWDLTMVKGQTWSAVEEDLAAWLMRLPGPEIE